MEYAIFVWYVNIRNALYAENAGELPAPHQIERQLPGPLKKQNLKLYQYDRSSDRVVVAVREVVSEAANHPDVKLETTLYDRVRVALNEAKDDVKAFGRKFKYHGSYANKEVCDAQFVNYANRPLCRESLEPPT